MRLIIILLVGISLWAGATSVQQTVGGVTVGTQGSTGIYTGYTLVGGDQFDGLLSVLHQDDPWARYGDTHVYFPGARSVAGLLINSYDIDPYHTGDRDSNRGVPVGTSDTMVQNNGLAIKVRTANGGETPYINTRALVSGMIHSGTYITVTPPAIVEATVSFTTSNPSGWHPTFWLQPASPQDSYDTSPSPGGVEFDMVEGSSIGGTAGFNTHGTTIGPASGSTTPGAYSPYPSGSHLYSIVLSATDAKYYFDGALVRTVLQDTTNINRPYYIMFTGHTLTAAFNGDTGVDLAAWATKGATGATMTAGYYRVWLPNAKATNILRPSTTLPVQQVAFNSSFTYTFPSAAVLWGSSFAGTDYCQAQRHEDFEPGGTQNAGSGGAGTTSYFPFPAALTWNSTTRVLSGTFSTGNPGRLHIICTPYLAGGSMGYSARGYIDVGPTITTSSLTAVHGSPYSHDLYYECAVGTLTPKVVSVTGLPAGLAFDPATFLITGTPTTAGISSVSITVTNTAGQAVTRGVGFTVT